jgi:TolA-binding protein
MDEQLTQLKAGLADLKDALSQAVTRIDAKLSALQNNNPDLSEEIQDVRDDIAVVQGLAADQTPAAAPTATTATDAAAAGVANTEPAATADGTTAAPAATDQGQSAPAGDGTVTA